MATSRFLKNAETLKLNTLNAPAAGIFQEICVLSKEHECLFRMNFTTKKGSQCVYNMTLQIFREAILSIQTQQ